MKNWNDLDGSIFFNKIFSQPIEIGKAYIHSLGIENDQPSFGIGFDIPDFPDVLPEKWKNKGYNTCRIALSCSEISNLKIVNLPRREIFRINIKRENGYFFLSANSKNASMELKAKWLSMKGPTVYINSPEPGDHNWADNTL